MILNKQNFISLQFVKLNHFIFKQDFCRGKTIVILKKNDCSIEQVGGVYVMFNFSLFLTVLRINAVHFDPDPDPPEKNGSGPDFGQMKWSRVDPDSNFFSVKDIILKTMFFCCHL